MAEAVDTCPVTRMTGTSGLRALSAAHQVEAGHVAVQVEVGEHGVGIEAGERLERERARRAGLDLVATHEHQVVAEDLGDGGLVVDDEDAAGNRHALGRKAHAASTRARLGGAVPRRRRLAPPERGGDDPRAGRRRGERVGAGTLRHRPDGRPAVAAKRRRPAKPWRAIALRPGGRRRGAQPPRPGAAGASERVLGREAGDDVAPARLVREQRGDGGEGLVRGVLPRRRGERRPRRRARSRRRHSARHSGARARSPRRRAPRRRAALGRPVARSSPGRRAASRAARRATSGAASAAAAATSRSRSASLNAPGCRLPALSTPIEARRRAAAPRRTNRDAARRARRDGPPRAGRTAGRGVPCGPPTREPGSQVEADPGIRSTACRAWPRGRARPPGRRAGRTWRSRTPPSRRGDRARVPAPRPGRPAPGPARRRRPARRGAPPWPRPGRARGARASRTAFGFGFGLGFAARGLTPRPRSRRAA